MEYGNHRKHSAGARNVKARAKRVNNTYCIEILALGSSRIISYL